MNVRPASAVKSNPNSRRDSVLFDKIAAIIASSVPFNLKHSDYDSPPSFSPPLLPLLLLKTTNVPIDSSLTGKRNDVLWCCAGVWEPDHGCL